MEVSLLPVTHHVPVSLVIALQDRGHLDSPLGRRDPENRNWRTSCSRTDVYEVHLQRFRHPRHIFFLFFVCYIKNPSCCLSLFKTKRSVPTGPCTLSSPRAPPTVLRNGTG